MITKDLINNSFIQKTNEVITAYRISKSDLAVSLGLTKSGFSEILNRRMNVATDVVANFCTIYKISPLDILNIDIQNVNNNFALNEPLYEYRKFKPPGNCIECDLRERIITSQQKTINALESRIADLEGQKRKTG